MSIIVEWDNQDSASKLLLFTWKGRCTWYDCKEAFTQAEMMAYDDQRPDVHIFDLTGCEMPQQILIPLLQKCLGVHLSYHVRKTILIERPHLVDLLSENLCLLLGEETSQKMLVVDSLPRARALSAMP